MWVTGFPLGTWHERTGVARQKRASPPLLRAGSSRIATVGCVVNCGLGKSPEFPPMVDRGLERCVEKNLVFMARSSQGVKFAREARSACCLNSSHRKSQRSLHRLSALSFSIIVLLSLGRPPALGLLVGFCVPLLRL